MHSKKITKSVLFVFLIALITIGCSDVQNREPKSKSKPVETSVSIKVVGRFTTTSAQTSEDFDENIEKKITKTLSQVLISGKEKANLFPQGSLETVGTSFPNLKEATKNNAEVSFNYFNNENEEDKLIVVSFSQKATLKNKEVTNNGKISFDSQGKIVGFNVPDQTVVEEGVQ